MSSYKTHDMYEEDPIGKTIREIYDDIDKRKELRNDPEMQAADQINDFDTIFWEEDANYLLGEIGIPYRFNEKDVPEEKVQRIYDYYRPKATDLDDDAIPYEIDPIPQYVAGDEKANRELYKLGHTLGEIGKLGKYYILLPSKDFSKGYFTGKIEKGFNDSNDGVILETSKEIKILDPEKAEIELTEIISRCFSEMPEVLEDKPKTM